MSEPHDAPRLPESPESALAHPGSPSSPVPEAFSYPPTPLLSPMDIRNQNFALGWRGYRKEDVRAYLSEVAQVLEAERRAAAALQQRVSELLREVQNYKEAEDELRRTVVAAERISFELKEQSRREAALTVDEAEKRAALLSEQAASREREALSSHEARLRELETTFSARRGQLEGHYQQQEHALETRARERSGALEREFSARYAELSGKLTTAHAEYANFMAQYRAVSHAFAQAASAHLLPDNPALPNQPHSASALQAVTPEVAAVLIEEQRF